MVEDLTVLLVGDDEPDEKLVEQLEKKNLAVEISAKNELGSLLALVEPHIVVHIGKDGAEETVNLLKETEEVRRVRLIVLADRDDLTDLRKLDRSVVVSLLATDIAPSVVAARVLMLAKKGPEKSLRPPSAVAKPPPKEAAPAKRAVARKVDAPAVQPPKVELPRATSLKQKPPTAKKTPSPAPPEVQVSPPDSKSEPHHAPVAPVEQPLQGDAPRAPALSESDLPTMAVDVTIPLAARPSSAAPRVILADDDVTRADLIACALRNARVETRVVPLDAARTHWALVRQFAPNIVMGDGTALKTTGQVWLQLFQADQALRQAKLVAVPFERVCRLDDGTVNLRTLIPHIPQLSGQLDTAGKPTRAPSLPAEPAPLLAPAPAPEAPLPFQDDDPDEFERLTVARPIDEPLPTEASRSRLPDLPSPAPAAGTPAAPVVDDAAPISIRSYHPEGPRPIFDSLAPSPGPQESDTPRTPAATESPALVPRKKSRTTMKVLLVALTVGAAGAGVWFANGKKLPEPVASLLHLPSKSEPTQASPKELAAAKPAQELPPPEPPVDEEPKLTPEQILWGVPGEQAPECEGLVENLEELKVGGIQQAAVSLGRARQAMVRGQLDEALKLMCEAVLVHPESLALEELSALYLAKGSPEQALTWYEKAVALRADRPRTLELGGDIHTFLGNIEDAKAAYLKSLRVTEDDVKTHQAVSKQFVEQAERQFKSGVFDNATLLYRRAAVLDLDNADAYAGLASTSAAEGNAEAAERWAEKTLSIDEGHHVALIVIAALATEEGEIARAKEMTNKALERNPNYLPAHQLLQRLKVIKSAQNDDADEPQ